MLAKVGTAFGTHLVPVSDFLGFFSVSFFLATEGLRPPIDARGFLLGDSQFSA